MDVLWLAGGCLRVPRQRSGQEKSGGCRRPLAIGDDVFSAGVRAPEKGGDSLPGPVLGERLGAVALFLSACPAGKEGDEWEVEIRPLTASLCVWPRRRQAHAGLALQPSSPQDSEPVPAALRTVSLPAQTGDSFFGKRTWEGLKE